MASLVAVGIDEVAACSEPHPRSLTPAKRWHAGPSPRPLWRLQRRCAVLSWPIFNCAGDAGISPTQPEPHDVEVYRQRPPPNGPVPDMAPPRPWRHGLGLDTDDDAQALSILTLRWRGAAALASVGLRH